MMDADIHDHIANAVETLDCMFWLPLLPEGETWNDKEHKHKVMEILTYPQMYELRRN